MVDLQGQYQRIKSEVDTAIQEVIDSSAFIKGPQVKVFQDNLAGYLGARHVIGCANGTDALQIALMALGLQPGDEVITPDFTFIATVEVIALLGLKPVIVDIDPLTCNIDPEQVRKAITPKTRAIIPVHLYGQCAPMGELLRIAGEHSIPVIEDNAQALGGTYDDGMLRGRTGTLGTIGCTSFFPSKNLGCFGDGGALITNDDKLAETLTAIGNHGAKVKYYNDLIGVNSRLDTLQAAILNVKLKYLDEYALARQKAAKCYNEKLANIGEVTTPKVADYTDHVYHQYTLQISEGRDELKKYLAEKGIPSMIYYPVPMHEQKAYRTDGDFPVSEAMAKAVLSLPMHTELRLEEQEYICSAIKEFFN
ncbi:MAG: DegT/DnrJ/EryC1/StrS family aminotransferase [Bacteroidales bacterium]|nr:DegT/DnrJ/EryC1/StrS family aminotransferase [Bacteroidales bacterium]